LTHLKDTGIFKDSAKKAGISTQQVRKYMELEPDFEREVEAARMTGIAMLEDHAIKRALKGSDVLTMFLLNGNKPAIYKRKAEGNESAGIHINISKEESEL